MTDNNNHKNLAPGHPPTIDTENKHNTFELESQNSAVPSPNTLRQYTTFNTIKTLDPKYEPSLLSEGDDIDGFELDPFAPFPDVEDEEHILTVRAVVIGCLLGALVNASNVYLGLKTGWTFSANLFGAIFGFAIVKFFSRVFAENFPILGGSFGPKENSIIQTSATAAGGLGNLFVSAIPALYQLNLLGESPRADFPKLLTFTAVSAYYGLFFATPLRRFFIIQTARELRLIFPTATATAMTIRSMHSIGSGSENARRKVKALALAFVGAFVLRVASQYAPGILWDWHIFVWFFQWGNYSSDAILNIDNWGWMIEWTPAFIGSGMLVGLNSAFSFFGGSVMAWGIIGPVLVHYGQCHGIQHDTDGRWSGIMDFNDLRPQDPQGSVSPRYWLLWPGVMVMICASFAEMAVQWRLIWFAIQSFMKGVSWALYAFMKELGYKNKWLERRSRISRTEDYAEDFAAENDLVIHWGGTPATIVVIILTCIVLRLQYDMNIGMSLLSIVLGFIFAFLAIQCTGATDITPLTTAAKGTQLVLGGVSRSLGYSTEIAQRLNLMGGAIASGAASQATDLTVDFRVGFLLKTPPRLQWIAQAIGSFVAIFLSVGMFVLFSEAYPCIIDGDRDVAQPSCPFMTPSVSAWKAVTMAVTDPTFPVPKTSGIFSICFGVASIAAVLLRHYVLVDDETRGQYRAHYRAYVPNFMAIGLAFVLPETVYGTAMVMGSTIAYLWARYYGKSFDALCYAVAAGMIAGEGMGGVVNAIFQVVGIAGGKIGSPIGCPGAVMC